MIKVEVCVNSDSISTVHAAVQAAYRGGASTVELCSAMEFDGLTPPAEHIREARTAFRERKGLMTMIRPRKGDFVYTHAERETMERDILKAAEAGADGVVFGILQKEDNAIDARSLAHLIRTAQSCGLRTTFHRAFDAAPDEPARR